LITGFALTVSLAPARAISPPPRLAQPIADQRPCRPLRLALIIVDRQKADKPTASISIVPHLSPVRSG
jgi:hypothetical protein